jgi:hypothetical protein
MDLNFAPKDAFRAEVRAFLADTLPARLADKVRTGRQRWLRGALQCRVGSSGVVLERQGNPRAVGDDFAVFNLHVQLTDLGDAQVA